jgi:inorganic triphosphatase YgiF
VSEADGAPVESFEIERKYLVDDRAVLPDPAAFEALGLSLDAPEHHRLEAAYFDTPSGELAAQRVAVRMRRGGKDEGWHLKEKGEEGARELLWPPAEQMPPGLVRELADRLGADELRASELRADEPAADPAQRLGAIARLRTERTTVRVRDSTGVEVVELADDRVDATNELTGRRQRWREWEAELMPGGDPTLLDRIESLLAAAGAARVRGTSKIQRTMSAE